MIWYTYIAHTMIGYIIISIHYVIPMNMTYIPICIGDRKAIMSVITTSRILIDK